MNIKQQFKEGLITNNPVLVQLIGMCATMAITTSLFNGIGMGLSVLVILTCCNVVISLIRKVIPNDIPSGHLRAGHCELRDDRRPAAAGLRSRAERGNVSLRQQVDDRSSHGMARPDVVRDDYG